MSDWLLRIWELTSVHSHETFQAAALAVVKMCVPFDGAVWAYVGIEGDAMRIHGMHLVGMPEVMKEAVGRTMKMDIVVRAAVQQRSRAVLADDRRRGGPRAPHRVVVPGLAARWGTRSLVIGMRVQESSRLGMFVALCRRVGAQRFSEPERTLLQALLPHLSSAYEAARIRGLERMPGRAEPGTLAAISDSLGRLHLAEDGFELLLRKEWPDWRGPSLPERLVRLAPEGGNLRGATLVVSAAPPVDGFTTLWARPVSGKDLLSARELAVAMAWASGRDVEEISAQLALSPHTVRNRVRDVYEKLGVHGRTGVDAVLRGENPSHQGTPPAA